MFNNEQSFGAVGILLWDAKDNTIEDNVLIDNGYYIGGIPFTNYIQRSVVNNSVNGKPFVYWAHRTSGTLASNSGQISLFNCTNIVITNQTLFNSSIGISTAYSSNI